MSENDSASAKTPEAGEAGATTTDTPSSSEAGEGTASAAAGAPGEVGTTTEGAGAAVPAEEITYHAVEKDGQVTAIWEMQGRKHLRTIDPRSRQGQEILRLYTSEHHEEAAHQQQQ